MFPTENCQSKSSPVRFARMSLFPSYGKMLNNLLFCDADKTVFVEENNAETSVFESTRLKTIFYVHSLVQVQRFFSSEIRKKPQKKTSKKQVFFLGKHLYIEIALK